MATSETLKLIISAEDRASAILRSTGKSLEAQVASMRRMGMAMLAAGAAMAAGIALAARQNIKFGKDLAFVGTMLNEQTMRYLPAFERGLLDMSIAAGESTDTLARGLYNVLSASIPAEKAMETLKVAVDAATAGMTDTSVAAYAITGILNAYSLSADRATEVSDALFTTVKRGQTTFAQLAPTIGRVTAISSAAKVPLDEVAAALATITRGGISTEEAITGLRMGIIALQGANESGKKAAAEAGVTLGVQELATEGLGGMIGKLTKLSEVQRATIFKEVRARVALNALIKDYAGFTEDLMLMEKKEGATAEALALIMGTVSKQLQRVKAAGVVLMIEFAKPLMPVLKYLTGIFILLIQQLRRMPKWLKITTSMVVALSAVLLTLSGVAMIAQASILQVTATGGAVAAYSVIIKSLAVGVWALAKAFAAMIGKVLLVIAVFEVAYRAGGLIHMAVSGLLSIIQKTLTWMARAAEKLRMRGLADDLRHVAEGFEIAAEEAAEMGHEVMTVGLIKPMFDKAAKAVAKGSEEMAAILQEAVESGTKAASASVGKMTDAMSDSMKGVKDGLSKAMMGLPEAMGIPSLMKILENVKKGAATVGAAVRAGIAPVAGAGAVGVAPMPIAVKVEGELQTPSIADDLRWAVKPQLGGAGGGY